MSVPTALRKANAANVDDQEGGEAIKGEGEKPIYAIQPSILPHLPEWFYQFYNFLLQL